MGDTSLLPTAALLPPSLRVRLCCLASCCSKSVKLRVEISLVVATNLSNSWATSLSICNCWRSSVVAVSGYLRKKLRTRISLMLDFLFWNRVLLALSMLLTAWWLRVFAGFLRLSAWMAFMLDSAIKKGDVTVCILSLLDKAGKMLLLQSKQIINY